MKDALTIAQMLIGIILSALILLQAKGIGLGRTFGGGAAYHSRRGMEVLIFRFTIILAVIFVIISIVNQIFF
jgi:preprotein translocase subunit SecG